MNPPRDPIDVVARYAPAGVDRDALALARAETERRIALPDDAHSRRRSTPRPRWSARRCVRWLAPAAAVAVVSAVVGGIYLADPPQAQAYAGWTQVPAAVTGGSATAAAHTCKTAAAKPLAAHTRSAASSPDQGVYPRSTLAKMTPVLTEQRGPWIFVMLAAPDGSMVSCVGDKVVGAQDMTAADAKMKAKMAGDLARSTTHVIATISAGATGPDGILSLWQGVARDDVAGIHLRLTDGTVADASVARGQFVLWWPGSAQVTSATITYTNGSKRDVPIWTNGDEAPDMAAFNGGIFN